MVTVKEKEIFSCFEQAFEADLKESHLTRQQFASLMWKDRHMDAAYYNLQNKLTPNRRPDLTIHEAINGLKEMGSSENSVRYLCETLGYNMPTRKSSEIVPTSEEEIKRIDEEIMQFSERLFERTQRKKELEEKINRVKKCAKDYRMTETN